MKKLYLIDEVTKEFKGEYLAQENPLEAGKYIEPNSATTIQPPTIAAGKKARFDAGAWVLVDTELPQPVPTAAEIAAAALAASNEAAQAELLQIDLKSIRAMREYIASKADAPQILKDRDTEAALARAKLK